MKNLNKAGNGAILKNHYTSYPIILSPMAPPTSSETLRVPAFRRKKSLARKAKKTVAKKTKTKRLSKRLMRKPAKKVMKKVVKKVMRMAKPKRPSLAPTPRKAPRLQPVGMVTHYYDRIGVGVIKVSNMIQVGDRLRFIGKKGEFQQVVQSMQAEHQAIQTAKKGDDIGLKLDQEVKTDKIAYKVL